MQCEECGQKRTRHKATLDRPYHDHLTGLSNVYLVGIAIEECACGEAPEIPRVPELLDTIALVLLQKPGLLRGEEIRYLRKHAGFPAGEFVQILGVSREHLSRVENGHTENFGVSADRLIRLLALKKSNRELVGRLLREIDGRPRRDQQLWLRWNGKRWQASDGQSTNWYVPQQSNKPLSQCL